MMGTLIGAAAPPLATKMIQTLGGDMYNATFIQLNGGRNTDGNWKINNQLADSMSNNLAEDRAFFYVGLFFAGAYLSAMYPLICTFKDREQSNLLDIVPLLPSIHRCFQNAPFMLMLLCWFLDYMGWFALSSTMAFYLKYVIIPSKTPVFGIYLSGLSFSLSIFLSLYLSVFLSIYLSLSLSI